MYYFDNAYLAAYLDAGSELRVFVDQEYLDIADYSDLIDSQVGIGYDTNGDPMEFNYKKIGHILVNGEAFDITDLQSALEEPDEPEAKPEKEPSEEPSEEPSKEPEKKSKPGKTTKTKKPDSETKELDKAAGEVAADTEEEPLEAGYVPKKGDFVVINDNRHRYFGTRGNVTYVDSDSVIFEHWNPGNKEMSTKVALIGQVRKVTF